MRITYLTPISTRSPASSSNNIPADHTGFYRNPLMTTDGYFIASHTAWALGEYNGGSTAFPSSKYDFRLKFLQLSNGFYAPGGFLTPGLTNRASYWTPDNLVTQTNLLWELDAVEVVARGRRDWNPKWPHRNAPPLRRLKWHWMVSRITFARTNWRSSSAAT
jgi:hypothetical protein